MPDFTTSNVSPCQAITDLIESMALQEAGLAHIINAEGDKIQEALQMRNVCIQDLIALNESVADTLAKIVKLEMVLEFKLEELGKLQCQNCPPSPTSPDPPSSCLPL
jgi:hypothetical protein